MLTPLWLGLMKLIRKSTIVSELIRLVYASRARFPGQSREDGIEPEVARILVQSRRNNARDGLVGALHYADGHFLQCLEGPREAVQALMRRLDTDPRHDRIEVLREHVITAPSFAAWSMKLVPAAADVRRLLASAGLKRFEPHRFEPPMLDRFIDLLREAGERTVSPPQATTVTERQGSRWPTVLLVLAAIVTAAIAAVVLWT